MVETLGSWATAGGDTYITLPTGTNLLLVFYTIGRSSTSDLTSLSYNSIALTELDSATNSGDALVQCWYLINPPTGSSYLLDSSVANATRDRDALIAIAVSGADTVDPFRDYIATSATGDGSDLISNSNIDSQVGDLVIEGLAEWRDRTPTVTQGQTELQTGANYGSAYVAGAESVTVGWDLNYGSSTAAAWFIISVRPPTEQPDYTKFLRWFPMQEESGNIVDEIIAAEGVDTNTVGYSTGHIGSNARQFTRADGDYFAIPNPGDLTVYQTDMTIGFWLRPEGYWTSGAYQYYIINGNTGAASWDWFFRLGYDGTYRFRANINGVMNVYQDSLMSGNNWYFVLISFDYGTGGTWQVWNTSGTKIKEASSSDSSAGSNTGNGWYIGRDTANATGTECSMEQLFFYDGILTDDEKSWLVNGGDGREWTDFTFPSAFSPRLIYIG